MRYEKTSLSSEFFLLLEDVSEVRGLLWLQAVFMIAESIRLGLVIAWRWRLWIVSIVLAFLFGSLAFLVAGFGFAYFEWLTKLGVEFGFRERIAERLHSNQARLPGRKVMRGNLTIVLFGVQNRLIKHLDNFAQRLQLGG
jgi:hypothetical protein